MKAYRTSIVAFCLAFICYSFSPDFAEGPDCINSYYWFHVKDDTGKTSCSSIVRSDLSEVLDPNQNGIIDPGELAATLPFGPPSIKPYGCPDVQPYVCALSYSALQITVIMNPKGLFIFVPTNIPDYKCCVKRTNP